MGLPGSKWRKRRLIIPAHLPLEPPLESSVILLIHPPISKPCEPPGGIAKLCGALKSKGISTHILDGNLEGLLHLLHRPTHSDDTWTRRALRHRDVHLMGLKDPSFYRHFARYERVVRDLNRLVEKAADPDRYRLGLANYEDRKLSPTRSRDLLRAAEAPMENPFRTYFQPRLDQVLDLLKPSIVGFSLNYLSQVFPTFAMMGYLRKTHKGIRMALGGGLVTSWVRRPGWKNPFHGLVDWVVDGPGEGTLLQLAGLSQAANLLWTLPHYDPFPLGEYLSPGPILPYCASRGCYWNRCSFCPERIEGGPYHPVPDDQVMEDLTFLIRKRRPALIHFLDNALPPSLLRTLAQRPLGTLWYGFARFTPELADPDFCRALKKSGCAMLQLGLESADPEVLLRLEKGIDLKVASKALRTLKEAGIATYVYLLFGTPAESEREARKTLDFTVSHAPWIDFLNLAIFNLPRGSSEEQELPIEDFSEGDLSLYSDFVHPRGWSRAKVRNFLDREFKRHPAIASILRRDPPIFTSNHAPFFASGCFFHGPPV
jgi:hypothetical protein